tara:strand:+ start:16022 stop:16312 length:291 start_codon:yes stop_codon:yes gene_type:complete
VRKADIITTVSSQTGVERTDVQEVLEATLATIKKTLINGDSLFIRGFGTFSNKKRAKKIARNISTNTAIILDPHYVPSFKPSKIFIKSVKENNIIA